MTIKTTYICEGKPFESKAELAVEYERWSDEKSLASIAISLKRIADVLAPKEAADVNMILWDILQTLQR